MPRAVTGRQPPDLADFPSDFYWEQDPALRFTRLDAVASDAGPRTTRHWIGRTPWQLGFEVDPEGGWGALREAPDGAARFRDQRISAVLADGTVRHFEISGEAIADAGNTVAGYRGIGHEVTRRQRQQEELAHFRAAMDASHDMIYVVDRETMRFLYVNQTACDQVGFETPGELLQVPPHKLLLTTRKQLARRYDEVIAAGSVTARSPSTTRDGRRTLVELHRRAVRLGERWLIVSVVHDISQRRQAEHARERLAQMYEALSATNEALLRTTTPEELYQAVCEAAVDGGKLALAAVLLRDRARDRAEVSASAGLSREAVEELEISLDPHGARGGMVARTYASGSPCIRNDYDKGATTPARAEGAKGYGLRSVATVPLVRAGSPAGVLVFASEQKRHFDEDVVGLLQRMARNIVFALENFEREEQRRRGEERIQYLATHDGLTGLPNRTMLNESLSMLVETSKRYRRGFGVLFIDFDGFKTINDSFGHDAGDALLREMAGRLRRCLRASDVVARIGGDEFVALVQEVPDETSMAVVADKVLNAIAAPARVMGQECRLTASIGIALYPGHASDAATLLKNADMAMYQAKRDGRNTVRFHSPEIKARSMERASVETHLRLALERDELSLVYQTKTRLTTGEITGVEALLRWHSPELGEVSPARLIPVAEETGLILPIGRWVLEAACAQHAAWLSQGFGPVHIAVNLSPAQFADPGLTGHVETVLRESGMAGECLELEITETGMLQDERALRGLDAFRRLGVGIAIDDFGTGYSSLAQMRQLPIDGLKIDRSFISDLTRNAEDRSITRAIISIGHSLGLTVIAEGVETAAQRDLLRRYGCDEMQGFLVSRPDTPEAIGRQLRGSHPATQAR